MNYPKIILKPKRSASISRKHPWVFSGAIAKVILESDKELNEGDCVLLCNHNEEPLASGHFADGSIAVRILSFEAKELNQNFWNDKILKAYQLRLKLDLTSNTSTTAYRLVHAEGDGLPGLIIDVYGNVAVVQAHSKGMINSLTAITEALRQCFGNELKAVYNKSEKSLAEENDIKDGYLFGESDCPLVVKEYDKEFNVNWIEGQKTGFFLDQRENRKLLGKYAVKRKVLNTFCYSGGFSIYALAAGAQLVHSVDSSAKAIELCEQNVALLKEQTEKHKSFVQDTFNFLKESESSYDLIILDPPAYAKNIRSKHKAVQAYRRLNEKALRMIEQNGILFTFSCSQVVDRKLFEDTIRAAAIDAGRNVKVLHHLSQPADHPVSIFHPEGEYLKGLVLFVE
ncbi:MAG: RlmI/RlmK family 23S rRNA methyltransferase [Flavobacteriales bacterium]|nr:RlmI/RlmK family 23S rRNA methyltransferase [Flavobacteriales bacterium]|tara:strand:- start:113546 stop:114739 length:1194 start_codon:yes stop_codon:yes gene_type:complete